MDVKTGFVILGLGMLASVHSAYGQTVLAGRQILAENAAGSSTETQQAPSTIQGKPSGSLSSELSHSDGVIKPTRDVDPGMKASAPVAHPNSMPVIPPSSTGGENAK